MTQGERKTEPLTSPDDITVLGDHIFTAFQNGVGPQGQPSLDGNDDSTVVEFTPGGHVVHQWDLHGKCDGITADTQRGILIATIDEDANSSVYTIRPGAPKGDFMLTSQGDKEQIFVLRKGRLGSHLAVLRLSQSVDDTAWARSPRGKLYVANTGGGTIDVVTGPFRPGTVFAAVTPCDADNAPATCPAKGFPPNYLGQLNPWTGRIKRVPAGGPAFGPQGMVFIAPHWNVTPG